MKSFKNFLREMPKLPLSALLFYLGVLLFWKIGMVPEPSTIVVFLEGLYENYGILGVIIASFLEGIVYLGLYFPGSFIVLLAVILSDGSLMTLVTISLVVAVMITITSFVNYFLGYYINSHNIKTKLTKTKATKGFFLSMIHPTILAFYFFNAGLKKHNISKIVYVPFVMFFYGLILASVLYSLKYVIQEEMDNPYVMITIIMVWLVINIGAGYKKKPNKKLNS